MSRPTFSLMKFISTDFLPRLSVPRDGSITSKKRVSSSKRSSTVRQNNMSS